MLSRLEYQAPIAATFARQERMLLLMVPPAGGTAADFSRHGLVADAHETGLPVDVVAVQPALDLYLEGRIAAALHEVVEPARALGYRRIWLLGISLGGMGALLYAAAHAAALDGVFLLAPFLGTQGTIAALAEAGGIAGISTKAPEPSISTTSERQMLEWLRQHGGRGEPALYLGYGLQDRFARGHRMLAEILPSERIAALPGGHDWACWRALWRLLLARQPFGA